MKREIERKNYASWIASAADGRDLGFQALDLRVDDERLALLPQATRAAEGNYYLGCQLGPKFRQ